LQQQLNVAKNVVRRLQKSLTPNIGRAFKDKPLLTLDDICTDKVHLLSEFLIESLLGISFLASNAPSIPKVVKISLNFICTTAENICNQSILTVDHSVLYVLSHESRSMRKSVPRHMCLGKWSMPTINMHVNA